MIRLSSEAPEKFEIFQGTPIDIFQYLVVFDKEDANLIEQVRLKSGALNINAAGEYTLVYEVEDSDGNQAELEVLVTVRPLYDWSDKPPVIILFNEFGIESDDPISIKRNEEYVEPGFRLEDDIDQEIDPDNVVVKYYSGIELIEEKQVDVIDSSNGGMFSVLYVVLDSSGNSARKVRYVFVTNFGEAPVIRLNPFPGEKGTHFIEQASEDDGYRWLKLECREHTYIEPEAVVTDDYDFLTYDNHVTVIPWPDDAGPGEYDIVYQVQDYAGNSSVAVRKVTLEDNLAPVLSFIRDEDHTMVIRQGELFIEPRIAIEDRGDINLSWSDVDYLYSRLGQGSTKTPVSSVPHTNPNIASDIPGDIYHIDYTVTDASGNTNAIPLTRKIQVVDGKSPVIALAPETEIISMLSGTTWVDVEPGLSVYDPVDDDSIGSDPGYWLPLYDPTSGDLLPGSSNAPGNRYEGHYEVDLSDLNANQPGLYRIRYAAYDNLQEEVDALLLSNVLDADPGLIDNRSEKYRMVHVLAIPQWKETQRDYYASQENQLFALSWNSVAGADGYKVYRSDHQNADFSTWSEIQTVEGNESLNYIDNPGSGCHFYRVSACWKTNLSGEIVTEPSEIIRYMNLGGKVTGITASGGISDRVNLNWDALAGADGYQIYVIPKPFYSSSSPIQSGNNPVGSIEASTSYSYIRSSADVIDPAKIYPKSNVSYDIYDGCPHGYLYFWVEAYIDPALHGWSDTRYTAEGTSLSADYAEGYREVSDREWVSLVMYELYQLQSMLSWGDAPFSGYWSTGNDAIINSGFMRSPSSIPGSLTENTDQGTFPGPSVLVVEDAGEMADLYNVIHGVWSKIGTDADLLQGRVIVEHPATKQTWLDLGMDEEDYIFSRWWYDNCSLKNGLFTFNGIRWFVKDWTVVTSATQTVVVTGLYSGTVEFDGVSYDGSYTKLGGPGITGGDYTITRNGDDRTVSHQLTNNDIYSW